MIDSHNVAVFNTAGILLVLLALVTGCRTKSPQLEKLRTPDWGTVTNSEPALTNAPPPPPEPEPAWVSLERWSARHGLQAPRSVAYLSSSAYSISSSNDVFIVHTGSLQAFWNGLQFWLGFAPQIMDGKLYLNSLDLRKNLEPLLDDGIGIGWTNRAIVIDPGHGGGNTGTQSVEDGRFEKEFTLDWAKRLVPLLEKKGWQVFLTRTNDAEIPLGDRVEFAENHKADFFLSLHFNASPNGPQRVGLETYTLTPTGMPSSLTREWDDDPALVFPNNAFDAQNLRYAVKIHRVVLESTGLADRGVRRARFMGVLRGQNRPAVLLEGGYLSNPAEARRIASPEFRQKLAEAVASALE